MHIHGIVFVGTRTAAEPEMAGFARDVLGLRPRPIEGIDGTFFDLPDGGSFAVVGTSGADQPERTVGFQVDDIETAVAELRAAGIPTDDVSATELHRYVHFRAPDGHLYELVETVEPTGR